MRWFLKLDLSKLLSISKHKSSILELIKKKSLTNRRLDCFRWYFSFIFWCDQCNQKLKALKRYHSYPLDQRSLAFSQWETTFDFSRVLRIRLLRYVVIVQSYWLGQEMLVTVLFRLLYFKAFPLFVIRLLLLLLGKGLETAFVWIKMFFPIWELPSSWSVGDPC